MSEHSKFFSPSSIGRRIACHGSARLEADIVEEGPKPAADWGTFAHHIADQFLANGAQPEEWLGKEMVGQTCNQEMVDCVHQYLADLTELRGASDIDPVSEQKVSLSWAGYPEVFGTADFILDELFGTLVVCDLKTGAGVAVDPVNNAQLMTYALMVANTSLPDYDKIVIAVSQPRNKLGGKSLKVWETTPDQLWDWFKDTLEPAIIAITAGDDTLSPSEASCKFCKATAVCPAYTQKALQLARIDFFEPATVPTPVVDDGMVLSIYPQLTILKDWIKLIEARAFEMATRGELHGFKIVAGRKSRDWEDAGAAAAWMRDNNINPFEEKMLTPAKAEKLAGARKAGLQIYIATKEGTPSIVPESDKRNPLSMAAEDFKTLIS